MANNLFAKLYGNADPHSSRVQDNIDAVTRPAVTALSVTPIMGAPPPAWILCQLLSPYANNPSPGDSAMSFHKDALGYVHTQGLFKNTGAVGTTAVVTVMPQGYRPAHNLMFAVRGPAATVQFLDVLLDGTVSPQLNIPAANVCSFSISYLAEQ